MQVCAYSVSYSGGWGKETAWAQFWSSLSNTARPLLSLFFFYFNFDPFLKGPLLLKGRLRFAQAGIHQKGDPAEHGCNLYPHQLLSLLISWWHTPAIPVLRRLRQKDHEFEASLSNVVRLCLKKKKKLLRFTVLEVSGHSLLSVLTHWQYKLLTSWQLRNKKEEPESQHLFYGHNSTRRLHIGSTS